MDILYCSSEALPFAGSGGLADVAGSLPQSLCRKNQDCRIVMPLYGSIKQELRDTMQFITNFTVPVAWRQQYCGIFMSQWNGCTYYFIDNEYYFKRDNLYGYFDDAERFAFFSRAILEMLPRIDFHPDIINANDWQTALVPTYYYTMYSKDSWYSNIKCIITIHNIQYQGMYGWQVNNECVGIPEEYCYLLDMNGDVNFLKSAIETSVRVTTVSPSYVCEIRDPWFSHGLDSILNLRYYKLVGILNGIDVDSYNPQTDKNIYKHYSADNMKGKAENKKELQKRLGLEVKKDAPIVAMVTRLAGHKGLDMVRMGLDEIMQENQDMQFVLLGSGEAQYEDFFRGMEQKYKGRLCSYIGFVPELARKIYAGADIFLMPSKAEPCGLSQMIALRYGTIPVVREVGGLRDSVKDSQDGVGNGFTFRNYDTADMLNCLRRALGAYADKKGWKILVERAMRCDNSWEKSAKEYINLYRETLTWD